MSIFWFIVSFLLTWATGLLPAILTRYVLVKRPMGKLGAIALSIIAGLGVFTLFWYLHYLAGELESYGNRSHVVLLLVGYASYLILRRGANPTKTKHQTPNY